MFRHKSFKISKPQPREVCLRVVKSEFTSDGVEVQSVVNVPASEEHSPIPGPADYKLSDLMAAGIPIKPVSASIFDDGPTDAQIEALGKALDDYKDDNVEEPKE